MKKCLLIFSIIGILSLLVSCGSQEKRNSSHSTAVKESASQTAEKSSDPKFEFTKEIHKFGAVAQGEIVVCNFYYKNVGNRDLIISNVEASCGCTAVSWDKKPLKPGEESKISVEFNSAGRYGKQYKTISIFANVPEKVKELVITAEVN